MWSELWHSFKVHCKTKIRILTHIVHIYVQSVLLVFNPFFNSGLVKMLWDLHALWSKDCPPALPMHDEFASPNLWDSSDKTICFLLTNGRIWGVRVCAQYVIQWGCVGPMKGDESIVECEYHAQHWCLEYISLSVCAYKMRWYIDCLTGQYYSKTNSIKSISCLFSFCFQGLVSGAAASIPWTLSLSSLQCCTTNIRTTLDSHCLQTIKVSWGVNTYMLFQWLQ